MKKGAHPPPIPPPQQAAMPANHPPTAQQKPSGEAIVAGKIHLAPDIAAALPKQAVLYIMARPAPSGPPIAVKRLPLPSFPFAYQITQEDAGMMPGQDIDLKTLDALYLSVKIDQDGKVGPAQAGDMEGVSADNPIVPGNQKADILIDKVH